MPSSNNDFELKINFGCGPIQPPKWINVDGSIRAWSVSHLSLLDRLLIALHLFPPTEYNSRIFFHRFTKSLPWRDNSIDVIYAGEVLEHLTYEKGEMLLKECYRILKRGGGIIRIRVPDNVRFWENYLTEFKRMKETPRNEWTLQHTRWIEMFFRDICVRRPSIIHSMGHYHKWAYDEVSLTKALEIIGFVDVDRKRYLESRIADVADVETRDDLIIESVKP